MSYTMTLDMPQKEASYVARHSEQFVRELNAIALVMVQARMQNDADASESDLDFVADWGRFKVQDGELNLSRVNAPFREVDFGASDESDDYDSVCALTNVLYSR